MGNSLQVGGTANLRGFFTKALYLRNQPSLEVERRLGYRAGRLDEGWWLCFLLQMPRGDDFEVRGYSQMSGGVAQGHLASPPDPKNAEQKLKADGFDMAKIKGDLIVNTFRLSGPERLAKVIPARGEFGENDYPPGSGIPQWTLTKPLQFMVAAFVGPREQYMGFYA
jgi:hypothetical protein